MIRLLHKLEPVLIRVYRSVSDPPCPNLRGDRDIEYSWIAGECPNGPGQALDFGCGSSYLSMVAVRRGFTVTAVDLNPVHWFYVHRRLRFLEGNILDLEIQNESLDLIINCSAIEHVGLERYGNRVDSEGDVVAMGCLQRLLKPGGTMLMTIPVGLDATFTPLHRVYGPERLGRLLSGYSVQTQEFWVKDTQNRWVLTDEAEALRRKPTATCYGLGCFVLSVPDKDLDRC